MVKLNNQPEVSTRPLSMSHLEDHWHCLSDYALTDFRVVSASYKAIELLGAGPNTVLDVGCGIGAFTAFAKMRGIDCLGIDISKSQVREARAIMKRTGLSPDLIQECSVEVLVQQKSRFDACAALDVLEHIEDRNAFLCELKKVLVPGGRLVISVPAIPAFYNERDRRNGHFLRYDHSILRKELIDAGWVVEYLEYWNLLGWVHRKIVKQKLANDDGLGYNFRSSSSIRARILNWGLRHYFLLIENHLTPPCGMSLFAVATTPK